MRLVCVDGHYTSLKGTCLEYYVAGTMMSQPTPLLPTPLPTWKVGQESGGASKKERCLVCCSHLFNFPTFASPSAPLLSASVAVKTDSCLVATPQEGSCRAGKSVKK